MLRVDAVDSLATATLLHMLRVAEVFKRVIPKVQGRRKPAPLEPLPAPTAQSRICRLLSRGLVNGHVFMYNRYDVVDALGQGIRCAQCLRTARTVVSLTKLAYARCRAAPAPRVWCPLRAYNGIVARKGIEVPYDLNAIGTRCIVLRAMEVGR